MHRCEVGAGAERLLAAAYVQYGDLRIIGDPVQHRVEARDEFAIERVHRRTRECRHHHATDALA
jgi:hypothetical protein